MNARRYVALAVAVVALLAMAPVHAAVTLHPLFTDHMVVQQKMKVPVWGTAEPGERVTVSLDNRTATATACPKGKWMAELKPLKAGGPYELSVTADSGSVTVKDVLVGEVWVCSGQSNMQWTVSNSKDADQEIANATYPRIRLFTVPRVVADTPQDTVDAAWQECMPETVPGFSAAAYYFGRTIHKELDVPVGLIHTSWGGTPAETWTSLPKLESIPEFKPILDRWDQYIADYPTAIQKYEQTTLKQWEEQAKKAKAEGKQAPRRPRPPHGPDSAWRPASLYNAMIAPLIPYAIQGAIWYQGESNAGRAYQYRTLFPAMIECWREDWGQGAFPFLFVQLANWQQHPAEPVDDPWAELREAQTMTLDLKNTGMAVTIDIGEVVSIHPVNKQDVGYRLALAGLKVAYGQKLAYSGPMYDKMKVKDGKAIIKFDCAFDGLKVADGSELKGFAIAGEDKKFVWANAEIVGKKKVAVWSDSVAEPVAVRYGWSINPEVSLYNGAGLPASPFRTDDWPGVTVNNTQP